MNMRERMRVTGIKLLLLLNSCTVGLIAAAGLFDIIVAVFHIKAAHTIPASWRFVTWPVAIISIVTWAVYSIKSIRARY